MIYLEPRGGLCNRMRAIASAYCLAEQYDAALTILWHVSDVLGCSYKELFVENPSVEIIESKHKFRIGFFLKLLKSKKYFKNIDKNDKEKVEKELEKKKSVYIRTCHQFCEAINNYDMFKPIQTVEEKVACIEKCYTNNMIGIHIRRTDNIESIAHSPIQLFMDFMDKEIKKDNNVRFYLSTDSLETQNEMIEKYGDYIILNSNKSFERNSPEGMKDALVDLCLLSRCRIIAGSYYSSFSETAAEWGRIKLNIISDEAH